MANKNIEQIKEIKMENRKKLVKLGILPAYIDCIQNNDTKPIKKLNESKRFSTLYSTEKEYRDDIKKAIYCAAENRPIPEDLFEKLYKTMKELEEN